MSILSYRGQPESLSVVWEDSRTLVIEYTDCREIYTRTKPTEWRDLHFEYVENCTDLIRTRVSQSSANTLVQAIESYKTEHGRYPESLEVLRRSLSSNSTVFGYDPSDEVNPGRQPRDYYYELVDSEHYYLLGVGPDGHPFTQDDIVPNIKANPGSQMGLLIKSTGKSGP